MPASENQGFLRKQAIYIMDECIQDAKALAIKNGINQEEVIATIAAALFDKRAPADKIILIEE
ncbi:MAG: hypothetical protein AABW53_02250 [Nanoarchaeota archaeon]